MKKKKKSASLNSQHRYFCDLSPHWQPAWHWAFPGSLGPDSKPGEGLGDQRGSLWQAHFILHLNGSMEVSSVTGRKGEDMGEDLGPLS